MQYIYITTQHLWVPNKKIKMSTNLGHGRTITKYKIKTKSLIKMRLCSSIETTNNYKLASKFFMNRNDFISKRKFNTTSVHIYLNILFKIIFFCSSQWKQNEEKNIDIYQVTYKIYPPHKAYFMFNLKLRLQNLLYIEKWMTQ